MSSISRSARAVGPSSAGAVFVGAFFVAAVLLVAPHAAAAFDDFVMGAAGAPGCTTGDSKDGREAGVKHPKFDVTATATSCNGDERKARAYGEIDMAWLAMKVKVSASGSPGAQSWVIASMDDWIFMWPHEGQDAVCHVEINALASGVADLTFKYRITLPDGGVMLGDKNVSQTKFARDYTRGFGVSGDLGVANVHMDVIASAGSKPGVPDGPGTADFSNSAYVWFDGVDIAGSESGFFTNGSKPGAPGDANRDGVVNVRDLAIVRRSFGSSPAVYSMGDFNFDDRVDALDLRILRRELGASAAHGVTAADRALLAWADESLAQMPDPSALTIPGAAACLLLRRRADRRNRAG